MRVVVLGWGNDARGDDALGPLLLRRLAESAPPGVETIEDYQLQVEHALDLEGFDAALFVDASRGLSEPFAFREIAPAAARTPNTHALTPEAVLDVYVRVQGRAPPAAFVLALRGVEFELGASLSETGAHALEAATAFCATLMASRTLEDWRRLAAEAQGRLWPSSDMSPGS
jgi:hydrogenase maturation protease